jgi:hypothetical protein
LQAALFLNPGNRICPLLYRGPNLLAALPLDYQIVMLDLDKQEIFAVRGTYPIAILDPCVAAPEEKYFDQSVSVMGALIHAEKIVAGTIDHLSGN